MDYTSSIWAPDPQGISARSLNSRSATSYVLSSIHMIRIRTVFLNSLHIVAVLATTQAFAQVTSPQVVQPSLSVDYGVHATVSGQVPAQLAPRVPSSTVEGSKVGERAHFSMQSGSVVKSRSTESGNFGTSIDKFPVTGATGLPGLSQPAEPSTIASTPTLRNARDSWNASKVSSPSRPASAVASAKPKLSPVVSFAIAQKQAKKRKKAIAKKRGSEEGPRPGQGDGINGIGGTNLGAATFEGKGMGTQKLFK